MRDYSAIPLSFLWCNDPMVAVVDNQDDVPLANKEQGEIVSPRDYGLKHDEWRSGQREMVEFGYSLVGGSKVGIVEAATGTGKTVLPKALSHKHKTIVLVRTKSLQSDNYEKGYEFNPLYGRSNYQCVHVDAEPTDTAHNCLYGEKGMKACEFYNGCPYIVAKQTATNSKKAVLNYAYWLNVYNFWSRPQVVVCDEAHQLSDITLEWAGTTVSESARVMWDLPPFPTISGGQSGMISGLATAGERAISWLKVAINRMTLLENQSKSYLKEEKDDQQERNKLRKIETFLNKLTATNEALHAIPDDWYIKSGANVYNGKPAFVARPLTAKHHFKRYFINEAWNLLVMSATIGNPEVFADELGLNGMYEHYAVPSLFPKEQRPVLALDVPSMGRGATDKEIGKRADEIAKAVKQCPPTWSGIIHVTSMKEAPELAKMLGHRGLQDRVWVAPTGIGTDKMIEAWRCQRDKVPGSLNISWAFWEGYDGREEKISIVAKMPFPYLGDEYEVARRNYNAQLYLQRTAWAAEQGCGRSRRGRSEDYDTDTEKRGLVALADGSYRMVKKFFSESFRESIIKN